MVALKWVDCYRNDLDWLLTATKRHSAIETTTVGLKLVSAQLQEERAQPKHGGLAQPGKVSSEQATILHL